jgi:hypothetical protein
VELLTLFADKGVAIQNTAIANPHIKVGSFHFFLMIAASVD